MQHALYSTSASRVYVARWALRRNEKRFVDAFAPATFLARALLLALPLWLLARWSELVAWLLLRFVSSEEITDGNVNFSFAVRGRGGLTLFVKQARPYLKWQPQMSLERDRMAREVRYFREVEATLERHLATRFLPAIHDFDAAHSVLVMDFLADHVVLFEQLFAKRHLPRAAAEGLAEYVACVAGRTLAPAGGDAASAYRSVAYWNPTLRAIQEEHVYTACFRECEMGRKLAEDPELMGEVAMLKAKYLGYGFDARDRWALCHGDLHPGGVMIRGSDVKVIDPEFTVVAPPGLDFGSLMSGFVLAYLYHALGLAPAGAAHAAPSSPDPLRGDDHVDYLEALRCMWARAEEVLREEGVSDEQIERIGEDTVGFAMMEVVRTALGFAGARDPARRIADPEALAYYQRVAVGLVRHCLLRRRSGGPSVLFEQMEMAEQSAEGWRQARARKKLGLLGKLKSA